MLHGNRTYLLMNDDGQINEGHSISAGLDYPGIGPEHSWLKEIGRVDYSSVTDVEALEAFKPYQPSEILSAFPPCAHAPEKCPSRFPEGQRNAELMKLANLWHRQGRDLGFVRSHLLTTNAERCDPPLDESEVVDIAKRASAHPRKAKVLRPLAFMDTPSYIGLSYKAKALLVEVERLAELCGNGNIALVGSALQSRGFPDQTRHRAIVELRDAGFIVRTREPVYGQQGCEKVCALYRCSHLPLYAKLAVIE